MIERNKENGLFAPVSKELKENGIDVLFTKSFTEDYETSAYVIAMVKGKPHMAEFGYCSCGDISEETVSSITKALEPITMEMLFSGFIYKRVHAEESKQFYLEVAKEFFKAKIIKFSYISSGYWNKALIVIFLDKKNKLHLSLTTRDDVFDRKFLPFNQENMDQLLEEYEKPDDDEDKDNSTLKEEIKIHLNELQILLPLIYKKHIIK